MCTVSYIPLHPRGYILTSSRDEKAIRPPARAPELRMLGGRDVCFPLDPQGQGTWIAASREATLCLLNGGLVPHRPQPPYRHSRGLVIPHFFGFPSLDAFLQEYDCRGIEPFTLILVPEARLVEFRWTGRRKIIQEKDPRLPHIWSSVTLYSPEVIERREGWFRKWLAGSVRTSVEDIRRFHLTAGDGDRENDLRMNRNNQLFTVSLTSIRRETGEAELFYEDLLNQQSTQKTLYRTYEPACLLDR